MTIQDEKQDWAEVLGFDRLPEHIVDKRVTELMDLSGKKAVVTGAGETAWVRRSPIGWAGWVPTSR